MSDITSALPDLPGASALETWLEVGGWPLKALAALVVVLGILWIILKILRSARPDRPVRLHPRLQKYAGPSVDDEQLAVKRREEAARILATSTTGSIAGYEIVKQVEAVFVDGFKHGEEALEGLKATAAMKGANAVANVRQERSTAGQCSASGDAVTVRKVGATTKADKLQTADGEAGQSDTDSK